MLFIYVEQIQFEPMYQRTQPFHQLLLQVTTNALISKLIPASPISANAPISFNPPISVNAPIPISAIFFMEMRSATISQAYQSNHTHDPLYIPPKTSTPTYYS